MQEQAPSRTAFAAAAHRAAHQVVEQGRIFPDPLALPILGLDPETLVQDAEANPSRRGLRFFIAARSEFAEAMLRDAVETRGVGQLVVLGAGFDTFAYRSPFADRLRVFEVDHPATQAWKRRRLAEAGIAIPPLLTFAPVDFERDALLDRLTDCGFNPAQRSFFMWLGVVPYLTEEAITGTLGVIGGLPGGAEVAFDYADPPQTLSEEMRALHEERAARVSALGEPFLSYFEPGPLHDLLRRLGFRRIDDHNLPALAARYGVKPAKPLPERGGHVLFAATH